MQLVNDSPPGANMRAEMAEQPQVLGRLAERFDLIAEQVRSVVEEGKGGGELEGVAFLARGSSDNAALLGRYAIEQQAGLPTSLVAPSLVTVYRKRPELYRGWLLIALSQSGRTPEIVDTAARYAECGALVVAVTNDPDSALAQAARLHVDLGAGPELAVPATKTVTSQMLAVLAIAAGLAKHGASGTASSEGVAAGAGAARGFSCCGTRGRWLSTLPRFSLTRRRLSAWSAAWPSTGDWPSSGAGPATRPPWRPRSSCRRRSA